MKLIERHQHVCRSHNKIITNTWVIMTKYNLCIIIFGSLKTQDIWKKAWTFKRCYWFWASGFTRQESVLAGPHSFLEALGMNPLPYSFSVLAKFSSTQLQNWGPCFLAGSKLGITLSSQRGHILWLVVPSKPAMAGRVLTLLLSQIHSVSSLPFVLWLFCFLLLFLRAHVISIAPTQVIQDELSHLRSDHHNLNSN